jgi:pimeloyl-ACP methyl ester carboxylesterase
MMIGRRWGDGPPSFVLLHGLGVASRMVAPLAIRLRDHGTVLAPDLPGFGANPHDEVLDLADHTRALLAWLGERAQGVTLVGCSLGAQLAIHVAAARPRWLHALVLASPTMDPAARSAPALALRWPLETALQSPSFWRLQAQDHGRAGLGRVLRTTREALRDRPEDLLARVAVPTLVLRGTRDPLVSDRWAEQVAAGLPDGRLVRLSGGRHAMTYEDAPAVAAAVQRFLVETTPPIPDPRGQP